MDESYGDSVTSIQPGSRFERFLIVSAFAAYVIFQIHATAFHGYSGQDWVTHKLWTWQAASDPWQYLTHYTQGRTNPPLYHLMTGAVKQTVGTRYYLPAIGLMNVAFGLAGVWFVYQMIRRLIVSPLLRIASIVFILFLPFAMIHAQVIAADALATPLFWILLWLVVSLRTESSSKNFGVSITLILVLLLAALFVKFTFVSFVSATAVWAISLWWISRLSVRRLVAVLVVITMVPAVAAYFEISRYQSQQDNSFGVSRPSLSGLSQATMNPRSILFLRPADADVLSAPAYDWTVGGVYDLLVSNKHSFPALLHLAMFTDILNVYQYDPYDYYFGRRTMGNHRRMQLAVTSGIVASLVTLMGVVVIVIRSAGDVLIRRNSQDSVMFTVLLFCLAWFFNIVGLLPFVSPAYLGGYWLPRLSAPALLGFFLAGFVFLDRVRFISRKWQLAILLGVVAQSALHASFLWPLKSGGELYESNSDVNASQADITLRVFDWQESFESAGKRECWLDKTMGIVINRNSNSSGTENWTLSLRLTPGPASPTPHRVVRISSRYMAPVLVEFDQTKDIRLKVPLAAGRNDVVLEVVEPERVVEPPDDPLIRVVRVSQIDLQRPEAVSAE